ncbi:HK97 family phage prohead protease [Dyadobacter sp. CY261]|uniref:HK97 family phage prohead protease n=1 Tax=Dyadobacter sp. CY261 TaxID=2907203 RepID=UPI001F19ED6E|nr:HK97 family phage prohead protease [Dyadobacter sp. CY261]MCF0074473.1 HK97 family phage prohead protease [Dyadobacter sp. CY261]
MEKRIIPQANSEVRAVTGEDGIDHIVGNGVVFEQRSHLLGGWFYEEIVSGAADSANTDLLVSCFNHDLNYVLGNLENRTMSIDITPTHIRYDNIAPTTTIIRELVGEPIKRGDIRGSSFWFDVADNGSEWIELPDGYWLRRVHVIDTIYEMGPVTMAAYPQTTTDIAKRSFDQFEQARKAAVTRSLRQLADMKMRLLRLK